jgi:hypothetical protein
MHRIRDYEVLFNICEGSFTSQKSKFDPKQELDLVSATVKEDFLRRHIKLDVATDPSMP